MTSEQRLAFNSKLCSANKYLEFRGTVIVDSKTRDNKDYICLDIVFNEKINIRLFDPSKSIRDRSLMNGVLGPLFEALGEDFNDIPPCRGGWHEFLSEVTAVVNRHKYTMLYAKLTVNEQGYIVTGEGKCFSMEPDMEYTDNDTHFLTVDEPVKSRPKEEFMPEFEDIEAEDTTFEVVNDAVNEPVSDPVLEFLKDGPVVETKADDSPWEVPPDMVFDEPSDLDDIFSKPPGKAVQKLEEPECPSDPTEYTMPEAVEYKEEKPKKKAPVKPKIPKGADPLRYIRGVEDEIDWKKEGHGDTNIGFDDLPY